jgi:uncharacterized membrane protein
MFAKFDETGRLIQAQNTLPEDDSEQTKEEFYEIPSGFKEHTKLKLVNGKIVELTDVELEQFHKEYENIRLTRTAVRKVDQLKAQLKELTSPELWDTYSEDKKKSISEYRLALDNITKQKDYPNDIVFPVLSI